MDKSPFNQDSMHLRSPTPTQCPSGNCSGMAFPVTSGPMGSMELFGMSGGILWPEQVLPEVIGSPLWRARRPVKCPLGYSWTSWEKFKCSRMKYKAVQEPEVFRKLFGWFLPSTTKKPNTPWMPWDDSVEKSTKKKDKWTTKVPPEGTGGPDQVPRQAPNPDIDMPEMPNGAGEDDQPLMPRGGEEGGKEDFKRRDAPVKREKGREKGRLVKAPHLKESQPESDDESDDKSRGARAKSKKRGKNVG